MIPSFEGLIVIGFLLLVGLALGAPLLIGLFASLPFGSTAFATLPALGGSSPLIYTLLASGFILLVGLRRQVLRDLGIVFMTQVSAWIVLGLTCYAIASAMLFPRLFAGQTSAFVPIDGLVTELPLMPVSGNITQTAYFTLGALTFFALSILLLHAGNLRLVRRGFFALVIFNAALGVLDLGGKMAGMGDILGPIRTASYALLTDVGHAGFWRIAGGYSEASAFGAMSLACLAFAYTYWRRANSQAALILTLVLGGLVLLSTSTTAYAGLAVLALAPVYSLLRSLVAGRLEAGDLLLVAFGAVAMAFLGMAFLFNDALLRPFIDLFETAILDKPLSESAKERLHWNMQSLQAFIDTGGVGVGMGSSRSSSWIISVISQLGVAGTLGMLALAGVVLRGMSGLRPTAETAELFAFAAAARASAIALLVAISFGGGSADPGILFFMALPVIIACRRWAALEQRASLAQQGERHSMQASGFVG